MSGIFIKLLASSDEIDTFEWDLGMKPKIVEQIEALINWILQQTQFSLNSFVKSYRKHNILISLKAFECQNLF